MRMKRSLLRSIGVHPEKADHETFNRARKLAHDERSTLHLAAFRKAVAEGKRTPRTRVGAKHERKAQLRANRPTLHTSTLPTRTSTPPRLTLSDL